MIFLRSPRFLEFLCRDHFLDGCTHSSLPSIQNIPPGILSVSVKISSSRTSFHISSLSKTSPESPLTIGLRLSDSPNFTSHNCFLVFYQCARWSLISTVGDTYSPSLPSSCSLQSFSVFHKVPAFFPTVLCNVSEAFF